MKTGKKIVLALSALIAGALLIVGSVTVSMRMMQERSVEEHPDVALTFNNSDGTVTVEAVQPGTEVILPAPAEFEGYNFLGWVDENGELISARSVIAKEDESFSTLYTVALETKEHRAYVFPDKNGLFDPTGYFSKAEAARMIASLLAVPVEPKGNYIDVDPTSDYAESAAMLYQLQITNDNRLHPDELITRGEYIALLAAFYPQSEKQYEFSDAIPGDYNYPAFCTAAERGWIDYGPAALVDADSLITRLDAVQITNRALGRDSLSEKELKNYEGFIPDLRFGESGYGDMLEAALAHEYENTDGVEHWTKAEGFKPADSGFIMLGSRLCMIGEDGLIVKNDTVDGFEFDKNGFYTSGNAELDEIIQGLIEEYTDEDMTSIDKLHALYDFLASTYFTYRFAKHHPSGSTDWLVDQAYDMLTTKGGNCFSYSAVFYCMGRALGYDVHVHVGEVGQNHDAHCWPTIFVDGEEFICDAELQMAELTRRGKVHDLFLLDMTKAKGWNYFEYTPRKQ